MVFSKCCRVRVRARFPCRSASSFRDPFVAFLLWSFQPLDITMFNVSASQDAKVPTSQDSTKAHGE
jgi:hypothetical protein